MEDVSFPTAAKPLTAKRLQTSQSSVGIKPGPIKLEFTDKGSKWTFLKRANATLRPKKDPSTTDVSTLSHMPLKRSVENIHLIIQFL
ncbi:hypothetical protein EB796_001198 [Bugula neritina]|uniref:Uncharacterized protein n=1 Tax=Bugula neritina TaxID=10212 RepID=A0A7J7KQW2_BUGNE|nr:hypothetical protein EB796_001198 [Bugula neritina]